MFSANTQNAYIPSKSVAIKPEVVSEVSPSDEIRIHIPSFVGFLAPEETKLKMVVKMKNARGQICPDHRAGGVHSLFRQVLYRDGGNATTLELQEDYNAYKAMMNHYTKSPSVLHKGQLFAGVQDVIGTKHGDKTLYYEAMDVDAGATATAPDTSVRVAHDVMVQFQLNSGIWKQGNIIPVSAMNGMRMQLQTDDFLRSCVLVSRDGEKGETGLGKIKLTTTDKAQGSEIRTTADAPAGNGTGLSGYIALTDRDHDNNPFAVNDVLYIADDDGAFTNEEALGTILGFYRSGAKLGINYNPNRNTGAGLAQAHVFGGNGSVLYFKGEDREKAGSFHTLADVDSNNFSGSYLAPTYELSEIEMMCQSVQPPPEYVEGLLRAANSSTGISFDIMSYELYRHNQANTTGLMQSQIPTLMTRAKSLFSQPLPTATATARSINAHSLSGVVDNAQTYEWIHGVKHMPSRLAPLQRYSQVVSAGSGLVRAEALHMSELQKAIVNVGERVLNLQEISHNFVVSRALTKYGQVQDLSQQTLSLRVDYLNGTQQKIFNNYVVGVRRIRVSASGVDASF